MENLVANKKTLNFHFLKKKIRVVYSVEKKGQGKDRMKVCGPIYPK
jgi:isochorismate hydrolase